MPGYAPFSYLTNVPGEGGTVFNLQPDTGARFPAPPFTYLAWPVQTLPEDGVNSEQGTVLSIDNDVLTVTRPANAVALPSGTQVAAVRTTTLYSREETVTLSEEFPASDTNVALQLRTPGGELDRHDDTLTESVASDGGSAYSFAFAASESGMWHYAFVSDQRTRPEHDFYVRFSEVH